QVSIQLSVSTPYLHDPNLYSFPTRRSSDLEFSAPKMGYLAKLAKLEEWINRAGSLYSCQTGGGGAVRSPKYFLVVWFTLWSVLGHNSFHLMREVVLESWTNSDLMSPRGKCI